MLKPDILIFEIYKHHGINPDTVAYMLSCWVKALANYEKWLEDDVIDELEQEYHLDADEIDDTSAFIVTALEVAGVDDLVHSRKATVDHVSCYIHKDIVNLQITWCNHDEEGFSRNLQNTSPSRAVQ